jgi:hypothetical protein
LSAGEKDGKLKSDLNRPTDSPANNITLGIVLPPAGMSAEAYFDLLLAADAQYCDCFDYDLFPEALPGEGYNSNSYISGLINATGGTPIQINMDRFFGGSTPLPARAFQGGQP